MVNDIRVASSSSNFEEVRKLYRGLGEWQAQTYHDVVFLLSGFFASLEADIASLPGEYGPPRGCLLLACVNGNAAGTIALKDFGGNTCEMKRLFVSSEYQDQGLGRALVGHLLDEAQQLGYARMVLETGPRQVAAQRLYTKLGFHRTVAYNQDGIPEEIIPELPEDLQAGVFYYEKSL